MNEIQHLMLVPKLKDLLDKYGPSINCKNIKFFVPNNRSSDNVKTTLADWLIGSGQALVRLAQ